MSGEFIPMDVGSHDLADRVLPIGHGGRADRRLRLLVRLLERPLGFVEFAPSAAPIDIAQVRAVAAGALAEPIARRLADLGLTADVELDRLPELLEQRRRPFGDRTDLPPISVVISTRERPESLRRALASLARVEYPDLEVLVVDNAARTSATFDLVSSEFSADRRFRYVAEPVAGLSHGRNCGLTHATHDVVAYTDDDVEVDSLWLHVVGATFVDSPDVACVTGLVPTAEIVTPSQQHFDRRVSWSSNCEPRRYTLLTTPPPNHAYPFAAGVFGTGANFAVRRSTMLELGGFDTLLGAGSATMGGEDLDAFARVLLAGHALVYEPAAVVWHHHRVAPEDLKRQLYGYGLGLSAYITKLLTDRATLGLVLRRVPVGVKIFTSARKEDLDEELPVELGITETLGLLAGPAVYLRSRLRRRLRR